MAQRRAVNADAQAFVMCLSPDVCLTPIGSAKVPVPYLITCTFDVAKATAASVHYQGRPAFSMASHLPHVVGDELGVDGGVISKVNLGACRPLPASTTVRAEKQWVVRHGDKMEMNCNGPDGLSNTTGSIVYIGDLPSGGERKTTSQVRTTTDPKTGKTLVERREVTEDLSTGTVTETHQTLSIDPDTGVMDAQQSVVQMNPDGSGFISETGGQIDPANNSYTFNSMPGQELGPTYFESPAQLMDGRFVPDGGDSSSYHFEPAADSPPPIDDATLPPDGDGSFDPEDFAEPPADAAANDALSAAQRAQDAAQAEIDRLYAEMAWDAAETAADVAGVLDPTPISDTIAAGLALRKGDFVGAGLSLLSWVPYVGDAVAKPFKGTRAAAKAARMIEKLRKLEAKLEKCKDAVKRLDAALTKKGKKAVDPPAPKVHVDGEQVPKRPIKRGPWGEPVPFEGRNVYKRNDLFDPLAKDKNGMTNLDRMSKGRPPIGYDGKPVNLHHLTQQEPGPMAEVGGLMHSDNTKTLHGLTEPKHSFRYSPDGTTTAAERAYNSFRYRYWIQRAKDFAK